MSAHDGRNPFGVCTSGHRKFRGGCPDCMADMVREADTTGISAADETHIIADDYQLAIIKGAPVKKPRPTPVQRRFQLRHQSVHAVQQAAAAPHRQTQSPPGRPRAQAMIEVWVSVVDTRDQIVAVGATEHGAIRAAARRTLKYLRSVGASSTETNTIYKCAQYFAIRAVKVPVGEAVFLRG